MKQAATLFTSLLLVSPTYLFAASPKLPIAQVPEQTEAPKKEIIYPTGMPAEIMFKILSAEMALNRGQPQVALANYIDVAQETQDPKVAQRATQIALSISDL